MSEATSRVRMDEVRRGLRAREEGDEREEGENDDEDDEGKRKDKKKKMKMKRKKKINLQSEKITVRPNSIRSKSSTDRGQYSNSWLKLFLSYATATGPVFHDLHSKFLGMA